MRTPAQNAELALLLEVAGTPKPGNVDRERDFPDLRFEHFLAGAVGAQAGLRLAERGEAVGTAFELAVAGMSEQSGGNTHFGALLLLVPLVKTVAAERGLTSTAAKRVVEGTTIADAASFYRAFDHVDVFAGEPPEGMEPLDVRLGAEAIPAVRERGLTLYDLMKQSADVDGVAREWVSGFDRTFAAADRIRSTYGPIADRAADVFLWLLADEPDTLVAKQHGAEVASEVAERARAIRDGSDDTGNDGSNVASHDVPEDVRAFAESLVEQGINPGTTADVVAAALFVALERDGVLV